MLSLKNNVFYFVALWYFPEMYLAPGHKKVPHPWTTAFLLNLENRTSLKPSLNKLLIEAEKYQVWI